MSERRAPVNGSPYGTISWDEHYLAWVEYHKRHWEQDAETIARRGGFGIEELVSQLGYLPRTWQPTQATRFLTDLARKRSLNPPTTPTPRDAHEPAAGSAAGGEA